METSKAITINEVENAYRKYLVKSKNYSILKNHYLIFSGANKPLKMSEILYSEINSKESNNSEKEIFIKKQCLDLYPKEFLDLKNINGGKYIYDEASKVMKLSHTCVFKLDPS